MQKNELLKKYQNDDDKLIVSKLLDKIKERDSKNKISATDFLNIHEKSIVQEIIKNEKVQNFIFFGGYDNAEREILILFPDKLNVEYMKTKLNDFLSVIRITLPKYNENYTHREYLGGIMKLGIKREKIGDILITNNGADIIVINDIVKFLISEIKKLTRFSKAVIETKSINDLNITESNTEEINIISSSYRIDTIVSDLIKMSRNKIVDFFDEERIYINGANCKNKSQEVKIGDKITVRGKGRFEIIEELGTTKNNNIRIKIKKYI